jgi:hypothetical protein
MAAPLDKLKVLLLAHVPSIDDAGLPRVKASRSPQHEPRELAILSRLAAGIVLLY